MKKFFTTLLVAVGLMAATTANAQFQIGLKGGVNVGKMSFSNEVFDASNRAGFYIGPTVKFTLPIIGLGIDASALYDQREAKMEPVYTSEGEIFEETIKHRQIAIPVNLRYGVGLGELANVFVFAGPQFGFNIGDKDQSLWHDAAEWKLKTSTFSVNVGLGAMLLNHLQVTANYNIACGNTGELKTALGAAEEIGKGITKGKSNSWQIGLAYYF